LSQTLYNRGWALVQRNGLGDREAAKRSIQQALGMAEAMGQKELVDHYTRFMEEHFPDAKEK
jgi:hypothetical protein